VKQAASKALLASKNSAWGRLHIMWKSKRSMFPNKISCFLAKPRRHFGEIYMDVMFTVEE
jgi:hypothetical protein